MTRARLRELDITIGHLPTGTYNAITDVPGVMVGHSTLIYDMPRVARTGVTVVVPREGIIWENHAFAAYHDFNGNGEMTGTHWLAESGLLTSPIALTNTHQVGVVRDSLIAYEREYQVPGWILPVVAETYDGFLNDIDAFHVTKANVFEAMHNAAGGIVAEGNVGGGTGMTCHGFKGGIGTSSRLVEIDNETYTVGVLVQSNYGSREDFRVEGVPVGRLIGFDKVPSPRQDHKPLDSGSIIVIIGTDAPLLPVQCKRLAQRATVGLARVGGIGHNGSGDIFIAFATGNDLPIDADHAHTVKMLLHTQMNPLFEGVIEATEEAILNALTAAETMVGFQDRTAHAIPLDDLQTIMQKYGAIEI